MSIYEELFPSASRLDESDVHPESIVKSICALADEIRAQRLQDREFYEADRADDAEKERIRQEQQRELVEQMSGMRSDLKEIPPSQTTFMVPDFHAAPPIGVAGWTGPTPVHIPRCICEHGIAAHTQPGTACDLCDCKQFRAPGLTERNPA